MSGEREQEEKKGFKVVDKRRFTMDGDVRPGADLSAPEPKKAVPAPQPAPEAKLAEAAPTAAAPAAAGPEGIPPEGEPAAPTPQSPEEREATALFLGFLQSLAQQCAMHLGLMPYPSGHRELQLEAARDTIDVLAVLHHKTAGNLIAEEEQFLTSLIHELRVSFLEVQKRVQAAGAPKPPGPNGPGPR